MAADGGTRESSPPGFGIYLPQVGYGFDELLSRARWMDELGLDSLWLMDHLYPPELPRVPSFEAWTLATAILCRTQRLRVGHLVLSSTFRHPVLLAKMIASLDVISGGRLDVGLGSGSYGPEHERAGMAWGTDRERAGALGEYLEVVTGMLAGEESTFSGGTYRVEQMPNRPCAVQQPRPPIHVGGAGPRFTLPLVARHADVWNCPTYAIGDFAERRGQLADECGRIGRDPAEIGVSLEAVLAVVADDGQVAGARTLAEKRFGSPGFGLAEGGFIGTPDRIAERIEHFRALGVDSFIFFLHDRGEEKTLRLVAEELIGRFR